MPWKESNKATASLHSLLAISICYVCASANTRGMTVKQFRSAIGGRLAQYLQRSSRKYQPFSVSDPDTLCRILEPGDVLLVEGNQKISAAIKYLTQSTWSHSAFYVGNAMPSSDVNSEPCGLIEALVTEGIVAVPLSKYRNYNTRICRPVGLTEEDRDRLIEFMIAGIGKLYDFKNIIDLARYLLPTPPVPVRWRRKMLALGSGDPTRAICSTVIAQAFQSIGYPILPHVEVKGVRGSDRGYYTTQELLHIRHHSLFAPRDFDLSPYFRIVKPTIESRFNYQNLVWYNRSPSGDDTADNRR